MKLIRWLSGGVEFAGILMVLTGVLAVMGGSAYGGAWWAVALTVLMEAVLVWRFRRAWEAAQRLGDK